MPPPHIAQVVRISSEKYSPAPLRMQTTKSAVSASASLTTVIGGRPGSLSCGFRFERFMDCRPPDTAIRAAFSQVYTTATLASGYGIGLYVCRNEACLARAGGGS